MDLCKHQSLRPRIFSIKMCVRVREYTDIPVSLWDAISSIRCKSDAKREPIFHQANWRYLLSPKMVLSLHWWFKYPYTSANIYRMLQIRNQLRNKFGSFIRFDRRVFAFDYFFFKWYIIFNRNVSQFKYIFENVLIFIFVLIFFYLYFLYEI